MAKVSVLIPAYNSEKYISMTLNTVLDQTFRDFEIICVEDCSTDKTLDIIKNYAKENPRIKLIGKERHSGPGECRNIALKEAQGEIISCVDSDDLVDKNFLKTAVEQLEKHDVTSLWVKAKIFWENENRVTPMFTFPHLKDLPEGLFEITPENISNYPAYSWNKFYKRNSIKENVFWSPDYLFEDVEFYYRYYTQNPYLYVADKNLYLYRRHNNSIMSTSTVDLNYHKNLFYVTENIYRFLNENNLFEKYKKSLLSLMVNNIKEYENFDHIRAELVKTVNTCLKNIGFPEKYSDLETEYNLDI